MNDAIDELNILYGHFQKLPRYTRAQFEHGEQKHFEIKLARQLQGVAGAQEAIANMVDDLPNIIKLENLLSALPGAPEES